MLGGLEDRAIYWLFTETRFTRQVTPPNGTDGWYWDRTKIMNKIFSALDYPIGPIQVRGI